VKTEITAVRKKDEIVLWPIYFDSKKTRAEGRRIPKKLAKTSPTLGMIEKALRNLGFSYKLVSEATHPHFPWKKTGLFLVKKVKPKNQILKDVAREL
jgi:signal recognition particle subunit SRP19